MEYEIGTHIDLHWLNKKKPEPVRSHSIERLYDPGTYVPFVRMMSEITVLNITRSPIALGAPFSA